MLRNVVTIDGVAIGEGEPPYIVAEMSANHAQSLDRAIEIVKAAKRAGADAVKLQTYRADTLTLDCKKSHFMAKGAWAGEYLYALYEKAAMPWEWTPILQEVAKEVGITLFSTPFDAESVEFLKSLQMPAYKIASPELIDLPLLRLVARTKKPIILSTGGATLAQIAEAVGVLVQEGVEELILLKCTSEYPAPPSSIHLRTIEHLKAAFGVPVGLSDHTLGIAVPIASVAAGACMIEKHFLLSKEPPTADSFFSATPEELGMIVEGAKVAHEAMGKIDYPLEPKPPQRSLIAVKKIEKGEQIVIGKNVKSLRPGGGIEPKFADRVDGAYAAKSIAYGTLLVWEMLQ